MATIRMALRCPHCSSRLSWWELFRLTRLLSVPCPGCRRLVSLHPGSRRIALLGLGLVVAGIALTPFYDPDATPFVVGAVILIALVLIVRTARMVPSPEDPGD